MKAHVQVLGTLPSPAAFRRLWLSCAACERGGSAVREAVCPRAFPSQCPGPSSLFPFISWRKPLRGTARRSQAAPAQRGCLQWDLPPGGAPSSGTHTGGPGGSLCWDLFLLPKRHLGSWQAGGLCLERSPAKSLASGRPDPLLPQETASILRGKEGAWIGSKMTLSVSAGSCREGRPGTAKPCRRSAQRERAQATGRGAIPLLSGHPASKAQSRWELCLLLPQALGDAGCCSGELPGY